MHEVEGTQTSGGTKSQLAQDGQTATASHEGTERQAAMEPLSKILNAEWHATIPNRLKLLPKRANERVETAEAKVP
jgi:hypothetical protein